MRNEAPAIMPIFRSKYQAELLLRLFIHTDKEFTISDLAAELNVPISTLHGEVVRLDNSGLISSRALGKNRLVRANSLHPSYKPLTELLLVTFGPKVVVTEEFAELDAELVIIFGSWAERYVGLIGKPVNDIDVLVVGQVNRDAVYEAADEAEARLGMKVNPIVRSLDQWLSTSDGLVSQIKANAHIVVIQK